MQNEKVSQSSLNVALDRIKYRLQQQFDKEQYKQIDQNTTKDNKPKKDQVLKYDDHVQQIEQQQTKDEIQQQQKLIVHQQNIIENQQKQQQELKQQLLKVQKYKSDQKEYAIQLQKMFNGISQFIDQSIQKNQYQIELDKHNLRKAKKGQQTKQKKLQYMNRNHMMGLITKQDLDNLTIKLNQRESDINLFEKVEQYKQQIQANDQYKKQQIEAKQQSRKNQAQIQQQQNVKQSDQNVNSRTEQNKPKQQEKSDQKYEVSLNRVKQQQNDIESNKSGNYEFIQQKPLFYYENQNTGIQKNEQKQRKDEPKQGNMNIQQRNRQSIDTQKQSQIESEIPTESIIQSQKGGQTRMQMGGNNKTSNIYDISQDQSIYLQSMQQRNQQQPVILGLEKEKPKQQISAVKSNNKQSKYKSQIESMYNDDFEQYYDSFEEIVVNSNSNIHQNHSNSNMSDSGTYNKLKQQNLAKTNSNSSSGKQLQFIHNVDQINKDKMDQDFDIIIDEDEIDDLMP